LAQESKPLRLARPLRRPRACPTAPPLPAVAVGAASRQPTMASLANAKAAPKATMAAAAPAPDAVPATATAAPKVAAKGDGQSEMTQKIRGTVNWYNKHGGLKKPLRYREVAAPLKQLGTKQAMTVLWGLEKKGAQMESPTAWVLGYASKLDDGASVDPEVDKKIWRTVRWYNKNGELPEKLFYREVVGPLSKIPQWQAMTVLKELDEKKATVKDPTRWVVGYARHLERVGKIKKTVWWYNKHGGLKKEIDAAEVAKTLSFLETWQAMTLLRELGAKASEVTDPTAWLCAGAYKWSAQEKAKGKGKGKGSAKA